MDRPFGGFRWQKRGVSVLGLRFGSADVRDVWSWKTEVFRVEPFDFHSDIISLA